MNDYASISYWDSAADSLSKQRMGVVAGEDNACWEEALSVMLPNSKPLRILDAGSGSGFISVILTRMGHNVVGIDFSPIMVQCAYETATSLGLRIEYRIMDCAKMDFENESFDAVVCCEVLSYIPNAKPVWAELKRVLKKEGSIIVFDTKSFTSNSLQAQGFSHCRQRSFENLRALKGAGGVNCLSGRKPSRDGMDNIPQINLFYHHLQTAKRQIQLYQSWCQSVGMQYPEYLVLNMISRHSKGVRPSDISAALVIPPQTLTRILAGLRHNGYIDRKTSERDQRSSVITITEEGTAKIEPLQEALHEIEERALAGFGVEELADLSGLSDKLLAALGDEFKR